jgi:hypothetical protein
MVDGPCAMLRAAVVSSLALIPLSERDGRPSVFCAMPYVLCCSLSLRWGLSFVYYDLKLHLGLYLVGFQAVCRLDGLYPDTVFI